MLCGRGGDCGRAPCPCPAAIRRGALPPRTPGGAGSLGRKRCRGRLPAAAASAMEAAGSGPASVAAGRPLTEDEMADVKKEVSGGTAPGGEGGGEREARPEQG